jgi:hypothetical protein
VVQLAVDEYPNPEFMSFQSKGEKVGAMKKGLR